jgi:hypothetical protein
MPRITNPWWTILRQDAVAFDEMTGATVLLSVAGTLEMATGQGLAIGLFTDERLAREFVQHYAPKMGGKKLVPLDSTEAFLTLLKTAELNDTAVVAFDPPPEPSAGTPIKTRPIAEVIAMVERLQHEPPQTGSDAHER